MINRLKSEYEAMSGKRKAVYGVLFGVVIVLAVLLLTGIWDPAAVPTS